MITGDQREPMYVAQTFEVDHTSSDESARAWFSARAQEAMTRGGVRTRRTVDRGGLLIEVWDGHLPPDEGDHRWGFVKGDKER